MFLAISTGWGWVIDSELLSQTLGNGSISLIHSPHERPMIISKSISEERKEKLSRYRSKKNKRNFGRKIKVKILINSSMFCPFLCKCVVKTCKLSSNWQHFHARILETNLLNRLNTQYKLFTCNKGDSLTFPVSHISPLNPFLAKKLYFVSFLFSMPAGRLLLTANQGSAEGLRGLKNPTARDYNFWLTIVRRSLGMK